MRFADLAIPSPLDRAFTYSVPEGAGLAPGMRAEVDFRRRRAIGVVLGVSDTPPEGVGLSMIKPVSRVLDSEPALAPKLLDLVRWMSGYYCAPIGEAMRAALPTRMLRAECPKTTRPTTPPEIHPLGEADVELDRDQRRALEEISGAIGSGHRTFLLHGVTGSGKTEVYLRLFERLVARGRQCLLLVPEIGLAPQLTGRAAARFGQRVAVYHSGLTDAQRHAQWQRIRGGEVDVVIGTRSALFAPLPALGAIVVDEEHDSSYKQDEGFAYHGRDSAIMRAHLEGAICVLGSATPSLESMSNASSDKYALCELPLRARGARMPCVDVVDMRAARTSGAGFTALSPELHRAIGDALGHGEQVLLFMGRRGFASAVHCESCGELARCPNCDISLTAHSGRGGDRLVCHYCDYATPYPEACPSCGSSEITPVGHGTQRLEGELADFFPDARVARLDSDMAASPRARNSVVKRMREGAIDILVGTQMVTKGHDFPGITLVGVVSADQALAIPDFRAAERTLQLITQVAGRAGRGNSPGRVIVQTYQPEHPSFMAAATNDLAGFVNEELAYRRKAGYPPFRRLAIVRTSSLKREDALAAAKRAGEVLRSRAADGIEVLGPAPAGIERIRNRYRWQLLVKAPGAPALGAFLARVRPDLDAGTPRGARLAIDVDPLNLL